MDQATTHLIGLGHEDIGFIHYRHISDPRSGGRFGGYRAALARAGIGLNERWVRSGNYSAESGYEAMNSLLSERDVPTAVVTGNDTIAVGTIAAIVQSGKRVPDDIAVVGFDDIPLARYVVPALTTVRLPADEMAEECGRMILDLIERRTVDIPKRVFQADLIIRDSCGALSRAISTRS
jgi:LacI family transcriptional regulator